MLEPTNDGKWYLNAFGGIRRKHGEMVCCPLSYLSPTKRSAELAYASGLELGFDREEITAISHWVDTPVHPCSTADENTIEGMWGSFRRSLLKAVEIE